MDAAPDIDATDGFDVRLLHALGTDAFKPDFDFTLLGWERDGATLRLLRRGDRGWLRLLDARIGVGRLDDRVAGDAVIDEGVAVGASQVIVRRTGDRREAPTFDLWDVERGTRLGTFASWQGAEGGLVPSDDAGLVAVSDGSTLSLYRLPTGERLSRWSASPPFALSPDGSMVLFQQPYKLRPRLFVRRADGGQVTALDPGRTSPFVAAFGRDGRTVVGGRRDGSIACWNLPSGSLRWEARAHDRAVLSVRPSRDGGAWFSVGRDGSLAAVDADGVVRWRVALRRPRLGDRGDWTPCQIAQSPDGSLIAVATPWEAIRVFDAATGAERSGVDGHDGAVACLAVSPDGRFVASGGSDGDVRVYDARSGETVWVLEVEADEVTSVEFVVGRHALRVGSRPALLTEWDLATGAETFRWSGGDGAVIARGSPDGSHVLVEHDNGFEVWGDVPSERAKLTKSIWRVTVAAGLSPDASRVLVVNRASGRQGRDAYLVGAIETATDALEGARPLEGRFLALAATDDGPVSVAADGDDLVLTEEWGGQRQRRVPGEAAGARVAALSTDGRWLVLGGERHADVFLLMRELPLLAARIDLAAARVRDPVFAFSRNGKTLALGDASGRVFVFALRLTG